MDCKSILFCIINIFCIALKADLRHSVTCGVDLSPVSAVYEGMGKIETYPWLGILFYPLGQTRVTTVVVLVTKQLLLGSASEIDKVPKNRFRARARVVLGQNCAGPSLKIRDYTYHPEFEAETYSALALIQLDVDEVDIDLHPICGPPTHFIEVRFYALSLNEDCENPIVKIHEMEFVNNRKCERFYRRSGVGFGVYGPGCRAPARFMDYGMYTHWVRSSVARIGKPAVTRLSSSHIVLRRSLGNLQRYGPCDKEEMKEELYKDIVEFSETKPGRRTIKYNLTIYQSVEYSCVTFQVINQPKKPVALLRLRRWCAQPRAVCFGFHLLQIDFYVEIKFFGSIIFTLKAYGRQAKVIDPKAAMNYANLMRHAPHIPDDDKESLNDYLQGKNLFWV